MTPPVEQRYHPRVSVEWPTVFFTSQVFGHGTVVDVSALAWRIRGSVPLVAGMHLAVRVWPQVPVGPPRAGYFEIEEGTVLWARDKEFALEIYQVRPQDIPGMVRLQQQTLPRRFQAGDGGHETLILPAPRLPSFLVEARDADTAEVSERRTTGRMLAHCHVHYRRTDGRLGVLEEGVVKDMSLTGCHILTKAALQPGERITLVVYFNDGQLPITLPGTTVCWRQHHRVGVRFPDMTAEERTRLKAIVQLPSMRRASGEFPAEGPEERRHDLDVVPSHGRAAATTRKD
jgi:hypothetical protein